MISDTYGLNLPEYANSSVPYSMDCGNSYINHLDLTIGTAGEAGEMILGLKGTCANGKVIEDPNFKLPNFYKTASQSADSGINNFTLYSRPDQPGVLNLRLNPETDDPIEKALIDNKFTKHEFKCPRGRVSKLNLNKLKDESYILQLQAECSTGLQYMWILLIIFVVIIAIVIAVLCVRKKNKSVKH